MKELRREGQKQKEREGGIQGKRVRERKRKREGVKGF